MANNFRRKIFYLRSLVKNLLKDYMKQQIIINQGKNRDYPDYSIVKIR